MRPTSIPRFVMLVCIVIFNLAMAARGDPCSRILWSDNGQAVVVGRNMDWPGPMPVNLYVLPRGMERNGMTGRNTLAWKAKYGSIVAEATDGMNEKGLAGHILWLAESDYGKFNPARPGLSVGLWLQYYLDNFAAVKEAVEFTEKDPFQLVTGIFDGHRVTVHLVIEDPSGDSAVIEYLDGKPRVYHGKLYTVMTNSPPYEVLLKNIGHFKGFGGDRPLPGTTRSMDRFVRGSYYLKNLPKPKDYRECIAELLSVMRNVAQPFGAPEPDRPDISATRWLTLCDLTNRVYYFESATTPNLIRVNLESMDFSKGADVRRLDLVNQPDLAGDCSQRFEPAKPFTLPPPDLK